MKVNKYRFESGEVYEYDGKGTYELIGKRSEYDKVTLVEMSKIMVIAYQEHQ